MCDEYFRIADINPKEALAGDSIEITIRLVLGKDFVSCGSSIVLDMPAYLGYSRPSCFDQEDNGYMAVFCSNPDILYKKRVWNVETMDYAETKRAGFMGMAQRMFVIDFNEGRASEGDEIIIKWGFTRDGFGIGTKVCTVIPKKEFYTTIHLRYFKEGKKGLPDLGRTFKGYERPVPDAEIPLNLRIVPREPERIRIIRKQDKANILVLDRFSNICEIDKLNTFINENINAVMNAHGVFEAADPRISITSKKLPLYGTPDMTNIFEGNNIYFGDLHTHSKFSNDCIEREKMEITPDMAFEYAKNVKGLDFMAVTDHHQPWDIERNKIGEANWGVLLDAVEKHNENGRFVAFPGFEFRCTRGDTAVILNEIVDYHEIDKQEMQDIRGLWQHMDGVDYITIPHFHNPGSLDNGEWFKCPYTNVETVLEIYSCHGSYESDQVLERHIPEVKSFRNDRHGKYFLNQGYHYGFVCNSDGHKGNPGSNGLTAVYAKELTRDAVIEAIRNRHVYGTTNARIRLLFTINGQLMGSILPITEKKKIYISAKGERPFKAVDLIKNGELFKRFKPYDIEFETEITIAEQEPSNWYVRVTQLDNHIAYSSPIWFE